MTCVDEDVRSCCSGHIAASRIPGVQFDAVYCADDTTLFSTAPRGLNELLKHMEICSSHYGFRINRAKCHAIIMNRVANIRFHDGSRLDIAQQATYLGNNLNHTVDLRKEVSQRIRETKRTWNRPSLFWKKPTTNNTF